MSSTTSWSTRLLATTGRCFHTLRSQRRLLQQHLRRLPPRLVVLLCQIRRQRQTSHGRRLHSCLILIWKGLEMILQLPRLSTGDGTRKTNTSFLRVPGRTSIQPRTTRRAGERMCRETRFSSRGRQEKSRNTLLRVERRLVRDTLSYETFNQALLGERVLCLEAYTNNTPIEDHMSGRSRQYLANVPSHSSYSRPKSGYTEAFFHLNWATNRTQCSVSTESGESSRVDKCTGKCRIGLS